MMYGGTAEGNAQTAMWEEDPLPIVRVHARDPMFSRIDLDSLLTNIDAALILHVMTRFINATREGSESRRALSHHEFMEFLWNHSTALTQGGHLFNVRPFRGIVRSLSDDRSMTLLGQLRSALQATRDPTILFYRALRFHAGGAVDAGQNYRNVHASMVFRAIQRSEANDHATLSREIIRSLLQPFVDAGIDMQHIHSLGLSPNDLASTLNSAADVVHSHDPFQVYSVFMEIVAEKRRQSSGSQVSGSTGQGRSSGSRHSGSYNSHDRLFK
ncbi:hypothetical protein C8R43DRAFT_1009702 [Mycena crocata]|nr:hypothetical protein C8R43DRAFT_1009702 [Mycena crocata]